MKKLFDKLSYKCSEITTKKYSTSFSLGIKTLDYSLQQPIYNIYGFVRFADEIVDSFHKYDKSKLLNKFRTDTKEAIAEKISLNPILNSFQFTFHKYNIDLQGTTASVKKTMGTEPRMISQIDITIKFNTSFEEKVKTILERSALNCPVHKSLSNDIKKNINFIYS
mgnify:CR=1 FL=1